MENHETGNIEIINKLGIPIDPKIDIILEIGGEIVDIIGSEYKDGVYVITYAFPSQCKSEPSFIQSAFEFITGIKMITCTSERGIESFYCDKNWNPKPITFASVPKDKMTTTAIEYHITVRKQHENSDKSKINMTHSTIID